MKLSELVHSLAFWKAFTFAIAGILALLGFFDVIADQFVYGADALLGIALTVLNFLGIQPELRLRLMDDRLQRTAQLLEEAKVLRNDYLISRGAEVKKKTVNK